MLDALMEAVGFVMLMVVLFAGLAAAAELREHRSPLWLVVVAMTAVAVIAVANVGGTVLG